MTKQQKISTKMVSAAAAMLGSIGGSRNTPRQQEARKHAASIMNSGDVSAARKEAATKIPAEKRADRARTAVSGRWEKYRERNLENCPLDNERFRELAAGIPAREIAEGMGVSAAAVNSWRRQAKPVPLSAENGRKFLAWFEARPQQHGDRPERKKE